MVNNNRLVILNCSRLDGCKGARFFKQRSDSGDPSMTLNKLARCLCGFMYSAKKAGTDTHHHSDRSVPRVAGHSFLPTSNFHLHDCTLGSERCQSTAAVFWLYRLLLHHILPYTIIITPHSPVPCRIPSRGDKVRAWTPHQLYIYYSHIIIHSM